MPKLPILTAASVALLACASSREAARSLPQPPDEVAIVRSLLSTPEIAEGWGGPEVALLLDRTHPDIHLTRPPTFQLSIAHNSPDFYDPAITAGQDLVDSFNASNSSPTLLSPTVLPR